MRGGRENHPLSPFFSSPPPSQKHTRHRKTHTHTDTHTNTQTHKHTHTLTLFFARAQTPPTPDETHRVRLPGRGLVRTRRTPTPPSETAFTNTPTGSTRQEFSFLAPLGVSPPLSCSALAAPGGAGGVLLALFVAAAATLRSWARASPRGCCPSPCCWSRPSRRAPWRSGLRFDLHPAL